MNQIAISPPEPLIPLSRLRTLDWLPVRHAGKRMSVSTAHRWRLQGCHGVRLRCILTPGGWCTTESDVRTFFAALTQRAELGEAGQAAPSGHECQRAAESLAAEWRT